MQRDAQRNRSPHSRGTEGASSEPRSVQGVDPACCLATELLSIPTVHLASRHMTHLRTLVEGV
eukprot:6199873-Pleurochrysis_carterae.AAC.1